jgi:hypothetical protein
MTSADDAPRPDRVGAVEVILDIGSEGGVLTIVGMRGANGWHFRAMRDETALYDLLNEEDREGLEFRDASDWVDSFETALARLDRYPWHRLYPLRVHPDFRRQVWGAMQERFRKDGRGDRNRDRWRRLCHGDGPAAA